MIHIIALVYVACIATGAAAGNVDQVPVFPVSAFKDVTAYVLETTQKALAGKLDVQLKWVKNADEAHADLRSGAASLASMSYDDTLSLALQENYTNVAAAWPVHGSMMALCGEVNVSQGKVRVGIDTDTGYARMLRQMLKKTMSEEEYASIQWVYAGATNLRYEQLVAGDLDATLLNAPFTSLIPGSITCQPFYKSTGKIQGTVGNIRRSQLYNSTERESLKTFLAEYKKQTLNMWDNPASATTGLAKFYNVTEDVATKIYSSLWGPDGLQTSFCFDYERLANVESIFAADTGIEVPTNRFWAVNWGCNGRR